MRVPDFSDYFGDVLRNTVMHGWARISDSDIEDHAVNRHRMFSDHLVPWIGNHANLNDQLWLEVGSGTGSSTLALVQAGAKVQSYEIDEASTSASRARLVYFGVDDRCEHIGRLFNAETAGRSRADGVLFAAVLEHMTFQETQETLWAAWKALKPEGLLVVADTPNRLCAKDYHTSYLPFFAWLPPEVRLAYASRSPREGFAPHDTERLTRWGSGISYHEFELALGEDIHGHIVDDGWHPLIAARWPIIEEDRFALKLFEHYKLPQHRGWARSNLFLIFRK